MYFELEIVRIVMHWLLLYNAACLYLISPYRANGEKQSIVGRRWHEEGVTNASHE